MKKDGHAPPPLRDLCKPFLPGLTFGFLLASFYRELALKIPVNAFFPHFLLWGLTGLAFGAFYGERVHAIWKRRPYGLLAFLGVFLFGIWVYRGDSLFFWTLAIYYPMPTPEFGWMKALGFLTALFTSPVLFFLLAQLFVETVGSAESPRTAVATAMLGGAFGIGLGYPAQFLGAEVMLLIGCMALLVLLTRRPWVWLAGALLSVGIVLYGAWKETYPILLSLRGHTFAGGRVTDHYQADFYRFRNDGCTALAINEFLHVYTCRDFGELPVELSYLNKVLAEGLRDYRVLIAGCSVALYPYQLLHANPGMERCVLLEVDRQLAEATRGAQEAIGLDLYADPRFVLKTGNIRYHLDRDPDTYDLLYLHRIGNGLIHYPGTLIPVEFYFLTRESLRHIFDDLLREDGVYVMDWGIPSEQEVRQFVGGLPEGVTYRAYWTTLSNNPLSGAPLTFVLASRNAERLNQIERRLLAASYFHPVRDRYLRGDAATTDNAPWLKQDVLVILLIVLVPFLLPALVLIWKGTHLEEDALGEAAGVGDRWCGVLAGLGFSLFNLLALARVTRLSSMGVTPSWVIVEAVLLLGCSLGVLKPLRVRFPERRRVLFLLVSAGCSGAALFLEGATRFGSALAVLAVQGYLLGQFLEDGLFRPPRARMRFLFGFEVLGCVLGIAAFQLVSFLLGFRLTWTVAALTTVLAAVLAVRQKETLPFPGVETSR